MRRTAILARAPSAGGKTRLTAGLTAPDAEALRTAILLDTLDAARAAGEPVALFFTPEPSRSEMRRLAGEDIDLLPQSTGDLGARMHAVFEHLLAAEARAVVLIGSDLPSLPPERIREAFGVLDAGADVALGPAGDGGYYLIALSRVLPALFTGITWGGPEVLAETRRLAESEGLRVALLPVWYDVDAPEDFARVLREGDGAPRTRAWVTRHGIPGGRGSGT